MSTNINTSVQKRKIHITALAVCCIFSVLSVLFYSLNLSTFSNEAAKKSSDSNLIEKYDVSINNLQSESLDGIFKMKKIYIIPEDATVAPKPNPAGYGTVSTEDEINKLLHTAESYGLLSASDVSFVTDNNRKSGDIQYYLDESILSVMWKSSIDGETYNFSEIFISHPSQFRRYLVDDQFGSNRRETTSAMSRNLNAVVGMSGDFYGYRGWGIVVDHGQLYRNNPHNLETCFVDENGNLIMAESFTTGTNSELKKYIEDRKIRFSLSFGPILINDGKLRTKQEYYPLGEIFVKQSRAAIGQVGDLHYIVCTVDSRVSKVDGTTPEVVGYQLYRLGCTNAYTLDGGQTATIHFNNKVFNNVSYGNERQISDIIYFATAVPEQ